MKVIVRRTAKRIISMQLDDLGNLIVVANKKLSLDKIKEIVSEKRSWITERVSKQNAVSAAAAETTVHCNADVSCSGVDNNVADIFCGKKTLICGEIFDVKSAIGNKSYIEGDCIFIPEKLYAAKDSRLKAVKACIRKYSVQSVSEAISHFGSCVSLCPTSIAFRNLSKGWLKCTNPEEKIIVLDYRICQLPKNLQHYLIVHAFSHFTNAGHDGSFWNTVSNYLPNYKNCAEELQNYNFLKEL